MQPNSQPERGFLAMVMSKIAQHCIQRAGSFTSSDQLYTQWAEFTAILSANQIGFPELMSC